MDKFGSKKTKNTKSPSIGKEDKQAYDQLKSSRVGKIAPTSSTQFLNKSDRFVFKKLILLGTSVFFIFAISVTALLMPELLKAPIDALEAVINPKQGLSPAKQRNNLLIQQASKSGNCKVLTRLGIQNLEAAENRTLTQSVHMAECFLLSGHNSQAYSMLVPFQEQLKAYSEFQINDLSESGEVSKAYIVLILTLINQLKIKMARKIAGKYCTTWDFSATCIAKLMILGVSESQATFTNDAYKLLIKLLNTNLKNQSHAQKEMAFFFHYAGAIAAAYTSRPNVINRRFFYAMNALPDSSQTLRKLLFYEWALALYMNKHNRPIAGLVDRAMSTTKRQDHNWSFKLSALRLLSVSRQQTTTLKALFSTKETMPIFSSDYRLVRLLTPLAIKFTFAKKVIPIIDHTYRKYKDYQPDPTYLYEIHILKARALIAAELHMEAFEFLQKEWETGIHGYVYKHLSGISLLLGAKSKVHLQKAKAYFDLSLKEELNWQSLYGKAKASILLQQYREAEKTLKNLRRLQVQQSTEKNFWADMLRAELMIVAKKPKALLRFMNKRFKKHLEQPDVLTLKASAYYMLGEVEKATRLKEKADLKKVNYTRFFFWNNNAPFHPMVFHKTKQGY